MSISKSKIIGYTTLIFIGVIFFIAILTNSYKEQRLGQEYMDNFNLSFSGIVVDKIDITGNSGILFLESVSGLENNYDPRDSLDYYCCIIKGDKAEIIVAGMRLYKIRDSISVNGLTNTVMHYRNNQLIQKINFTMTRFDLLYDPAKKLHRIK